MPGFEIYACIYLSIQVSLLKIYKKYTFESLSYAEIVFEKRLP